MRAPWFRSCDARLVALGVLCSSLVLGSCRCSQESGKASVVAKTPSNPAPSATLEPSESRLIDLLHRAAVLVVTSSHKDALSLGEFLVDEQASSAWRPNPPDPNPWFELRFAHDVEVHALSVDVATPESTVLELELRSPELGAATRREQTYEFTPNKPVRVRTLRVAVSYNERPTTIAPAQQIALSELRVRGTLETEWQLEPALPEVRVARAEPRPSIDTPAFRAWWRNAPYRDSDAVCAAYEASMNAPEQGQQYLPEGVKFAHCRIDETPLRPIGKPPPRVKSVHRGGFQLAADSEGGADFLVVQTDAGWSVANLWSTTDTYDGTCPGMQVAYANVARTFWDGPVLVQERKRLFYPPTGTYVDDGTRPPVAARSLLRCDTSQEPLMCREFVVAYGAPDAKWDESINQIQAFLPKVWAWERKLWATDNGWLRFSPCRARARIAEDAGAALDDAGSSGFASPVPCFAPNVHHLP